MKLINEEMHIQTIWREHFHQAIEKKKITSIGKGS